MKAIVQNEYGSPDQLSLANISQPVMKDTQLLIRVMAVSVNAADLFTLRGSPWMTRFVVGFPRPKNYIPGWDMSGVVEKVGSKVLRFSPGDKVYAACSGTFAEFASVDENILAAMPENLTYEQAAAVPSAGLAALHGLRDAAKLQSGQKVLINGASGGVGTFAVQIAKTMGANVTGVCSTRNIELVRSLGADEVIDYTRQDFTKDHKKYDLILDNVGNHPFSELLHALTPVGLIVPNSGYGGMGYVFKAFVFSLFIRQLRSMYLSTPNGNDLELLSRWIKDGKVKPVIDCVYPLSETPAAFHYFENEHPRGKVVISIS